MTEAVKQDVKMVNLAIDEIEVTVPEGMLIVDAAKKVGIDVPVFCYHPKMDPVGMCRMCLVDVGMPVKNRETGEMELEEDGSPKIQFGWNLQTGCTVAVAEGMVVVGYTEKVKKARQDIVEFLLTSHPLDCPVCDKGGECPLQNLTMEFGAGESRFFIEDKKHFDKHVPLGDLIWLDRERCIQCARCTRFQAEIADDPVIGFNQRGRSLEITTFSDPGFDSYWSGNTSDICPVGALTTADFRFGARPWELQASASICNQCAVGCNTTFNTRRDAKAGGGKVIKRMMPRQNEQVNEVWLCDKGRFAGYQFADHATRITEPMVRNGDKLEVTSWDNALAVIAEKLGKDAVVLAGGRLSNEDLFNIKGVADKLGAKALLNSNMAGGDLTAKYGVGQGTNLADLGKGDAIVVIASDLEEEAPLYWLRVKQAAERGASLIVANPRSTKLDAKAKCVVRYAYGTEGNIALAISADKDAEKAIADAENLVVFYGSEGVDYAGSKAVAAVAAKLVAERAGKANNGLVAVWDKANAQGAWELGFAPSADLAADLNAAKAAYIVAADPVAENVALAEALSDAFVVVQELTMTATAELADVVLPVAAFTERDGTYTNAERRVQRFYPAVPAPVGLVPDFAVTAKIGKALDVELEGRLAVSVFNQIAESVATYEGVNYAAVSAVTEQWPIIGRDDVFYGGTSYQNRAGLGVTLALTAEDVVINGSDAPAAPKAALLGVPVSVLYDHGTTMTASAVLAPRLAQPFVALSVDDAAKLKVEAGAEVSVTLNGVTATVAAEIDNSLPAGVVLVPRSMGLPITAPAEIKVKK